MSIRNKLEGQVHNQVHNQVHDPTAFPKIIINGTLLNIGESLTIHTALQSLAMSLENDGLGKDKIGKEITKGYLDNIRKINIFLDIH